MVQAVNDVVQSTGNIGSSIWKLSRGFLAAATISTVIAASTGGLSLTADAAIAAGESIKLSPMDMIENVGKGFAHNISGAGDILSGWVSPAP